ncbi:GntR family transcriptional regulator [Pantoea ananatis]
MKASGTAVFRLDPFFPAERELSELIGVTRTTLREVLQRLARDGWLTIQHGKPTRVNNFWENFGSQYS